MRRRKFIRQSLTAFPALLLSDAVLKSCGKDPVVPNGKTVLVVGAGIAGLSAAVKLQAAGFNVTVIEADNKAGGRIRTDRSTGFAFDEGASWIHGPSGNPITKIATQSGANTFLTDDDNLKIFDKNGIAYTDSVSDDAYKQYEDALRAVRNAGSKDQSFLTVFEQLYPQRLNERLWKYMLSAYLEFDTGGGIAQLSSLDFDDDEVFGGDDLLITNGYDTLTNYLAQGLTIRYNERLLELDSSGAKTIVKTDLGSTEADYVVVTASLGILKSGQIRFTPELPSAKKQAIAAVQMGAVNKFLLLWDDAFWDNNLQYIGYTPDTQGQFNYYMNCGKFSSSNALMTFALGDYGRQSESLSDAAIIDLNLAQLRGLYGSAVPAPKQMLRTRWAANPFTLGAYSFASNGTRSSDFDRLADAVNNRVFFAGEHTHREYRGTVHGAYLSGQREADKIIDLQ